MASAENAASIGRVKWFNSRKGFGFIETSDNEYFVHQKSIKSDGFRTLYQGETVEFKITEGTGDHESQAIDITGVNGSQLLCQQNLHIVPKNRGFNGRGGFSRGGYGNRGRGRGGNRNNNSSNNTSNNTSNESTQ